MLVRTLFCKMSPFISCHGYCLTWHVQSCGCCGWCLHVFTMGALVLDCCIKILLAISVGCVMMLLLRSIRLSRSGLSLFWKTTSFPCFGFMLIRFWNLAIAFCALFLLYLAIIVLASFCTSFPMVAISCIHDDACGELGRGGLMVFFCLTYFVWWNDFANLD